LCKFKYISEKSLKSRLKVAVIIFSSKEVGYTNSTLFLREILTLKNSVAEN